MFIIVVDKNGLSDKINTYASLAQLVAQLIRNQ